MNVNWYAKEFEDLGVRALHDVLRLRTDVFVVEQACAYAEIDGHDPSAIHLIGYDTEGRSIAYARLLPPDASGFPHIGRVVVHAEHRGKGLASQLMEFALEQLRLMYGSRRSELAAQSHLERFYARFGFVRQGPDYPWDGIPHVDMRREEP
jgi:ElaA protein